MDLQLKGLSVPETAAKLVRDCGEVDILVNNAGAIPQGTITDFDDASWRAGWELKLFGYVNLTKGFPFGRPASQRRRLSRLRPRVAAIAVSAI